MGKYLDLAKAVETAGFCEKVTPVMPEQELEVSCPPRGVKNVEPVESEPDRQYERNELYEKRFWPDLAVCPPGGRAVLLQAPDGVPEPWAQGVVDLLAMPPNPHWPEARWKVLQDDALAFLKAWAAQAHALRWTDLDLFSVHREAPRARFDGMGLVPLLAGRPVAALTERSAAITVASGGTQTYRRRAIWPAGCCLIWELGI